VKLHDGPDVGLEAELVPAESPRLQDAVETSLQQLPVDRLGVVAAAVVFLLLLEEPRTQRGRARDQLIGGEARLGLRQHGSLSHWSRPFSRGYTLRALPSKTFLRSPSVSGSASM
jgi:hypothetical protein